MKEITDSMKGTIYKEICEMLNLVFINLHFYVNPNGEVSCWVQNVGSTGAAINIKPSTVENFDWEYFANLNAYVAPVVEKPDEYFYCTECGTVKPVSEYAANVFAGYYCKDCAEIPAVKKIIDMSHEVGFYD